MSLPQLIAHRGDAARYPENTLPALAAAVRAGAPMIEFDLQLTADDVPVLLHDASFERTAGVVADVREMRLADTRRISVAEPARFGARHGFVPMPTLAEVVRRLARWPGVVAYVEIKEESTGRFGVERVTRRVMEVLAPVRERCVLISFSAEVVDSVRRLGAVATGWCFEQWDERTRHRAATLNPDVLLTDWQIIPAEGLWTGRWRWAAWEVVDPVLALLLHRRGVHYVETMAATDMLADRRLAPAGRR